MVFGREAPELFSCRTWFGCVINVLNLSVSYKVATIEKCCLCKSRRFACLVYAVGIYGEGMEPR